VIFGIPSILMESIIVNLIKYQHLKSIQGEIYIPVQVINHFNILKKEEGT